MKKILFLISLLFSTLAYSQSTTPAPTDSVYIWWKQRVVPTATLNSRTWYSFWNKKTDGQPVVNSNTYVGSVNATDTVFLKVGSAYKKTTAAGLGTGIHNCVGYTTGTSLNPYSNNINSASIQLSSGDYTLGAPIGACTSWDIFMGTQTGADSVEITSSFLVTGTKIILHQPGDWVTIIDIGNSVTPKWQVHYGTHNSGVANIYEASIYITSAQILALNTTPVQIIPAPGIGKYIELVSASDLIIYNTTPYATNTSLVLSYTGGTARIAVDPFILVSTVSRKLGIIEDTSVGAADTQIVENAALRVSVQSGNPTGGNSAIKINVLYRIITL